MADPEKVAERVLEEKSDFGALLAIWAFRLGWLPVVVWGVVRLWLWHDDPPVDTIARDDTRMEALATIVGGVLMGVVYLLFLRRLRLRILAERAERRRAR